MKRLSLSLLIVLLVGLVQAQTYVHLILDASGSMWNKLDDGTYRITAAKAVLGNFIKGLPTGDLNVGLRVYGATMSAMDEGSCDDIELVVPMAGVDKPGLQTAVDNTKAKGATPIVKALEQAAADFPSDAAKKLIVLVTDGEESCGGDLNAIAEHLQAQGIELNIIGFALSQKAQESFAGIGKFVNAADAVSLASALETAVQEVVIEELPPAARQPVTLTVDPLVSPAGQYIDAAYDGADLKADDYLTIVPVGAADDTVTSFEYVDLETNTLTLATSFEPGDYEVRYISDDGVVLARAPVTLDKSDITMRPVGEIHAGSNFQVEWTGPNGEDDYITIVKPDAPEGTFDSYEYTEKGSPLTLIAPVEPGQYELRYTTDRAGDSGKIFVRVPVYVLEAIPIFLQTTPGPEIPAGGQFEVEWAGPANDSDFITITTPDAAEGFYTSYAYMRDGNNPITLNAPSEPGSYEVRYVNEREGKVLARVPVTLTAAQITLQAPSEVTVNSEFEVSWTGPDGKDDYITIVPAGSPEGTYTSYFYTKDANPGKLTAPETPGQYELRYSTDRSGDGGKIFYSVPITVK